MSVENDVPIVLTEIRSGAGVIILNRPDKRNALSPEMVKELNSALIRFDQNDQVKVIIVTGAGKAFCAGADLKYLQQLSQYSIAENLTDSEHIASLFLAMYNLNKPVIAAVNGPAIAGGCGLATAADWIIAHPEAKFGYTEVKLGFVPAIVSYLLLTRMPVAKARQLLLSGDIIDATTALHSQLIDGISGDPLTMAFEMAEKLMKNSSEGMGFVKQLLRRFVSPSADSAFQSAAVVNALSRTGTDFKAGLKKFLDKQ